MSPKACPAACHAAYCTLQVMHQDGWMSPVTTGNAGSCAHSSKLLLVLHFETTKCAAGGAQTWSDICEQRRQCRAGTVDSGSTRRHQLSHPVHRGLCLPSHGCNGSLCPPGNCTGAARYWSLCKETLHRMSSVGDSAQEALYKRVCTGHFVVLAMLEGLCWRVLCSHASLAGARAQTA